MPIYEYQAVDRVTACHRCRTGWEVLQTLREPLVEACPDCGAKVRRIPSLCHAAVIEVSDGDHRVQEKISSYEREGMWSHAAELADTHAERTRDADLRLRAIDNYAKAGYSDETLERHAKTESP